MALITCAVLCGAFTTLSLVGSSVAEAYQVLLKAEVVIQLIPFLYVFGAILKASKSRRSKRIPSRSSTFQWK